MGAAKVLGIVTTWFMSYLGSAYILLPDNI